MNILHTSDWHLGQSFYTKSRRDEHAAFLQWLVTQIEAHQVDVVIVAGDVFDTGTPPSYARELYNQFVVQVQATGAALVILAGNHDSVSVLNESRSLLARLNTRVVASTDLPLDEQVLPLRTGNGEVGAILCAVPFIRARDMLQSTAGDTGSDKRKALGDAIKQHYHRLYTEALALRDRLGLNVPIIATGHLTALGVSQSESVRDIYIGTLEGFAADGFPPVDYIALGHIHRAQKVAQSEHIRYCGSPIPLSFDELGSDKQVVLVCFDEQQQRTITSIPVPRFQAMAVVSGDLPSIEQQLHKLAKLHQGNTVWLSVEVHTQDYLSDLQSRLQALTAGTSMEVLQLKRAGNRARTALMQQHKESLAELTPEQVFARRLDMERFEGEAEEAQRERVRTHFMQVLESVMTPQE